MEIPSVSATHGFARSLPAKLERLVSPDASHGLQLTKGEKEKIRLLKAQLQQISEYLMEPSEVEFPASAARCWVEEVRDLSYDIDDFHDELVCKFHAFQKNPQSLGSKLMNPRRRWISSEISRFRIRLEKAIQRYKTYNLEESKKRKQSNITSDDDDKDDDKGPVPPLCGFEAARPVGIGDSMAMVEKWLTDEEEPKLRVMSLVGLGGVGKTTLANELYRNLRKRFQCRAFVRSSQMPDMRELLTSILLQVRPHRPPEVSESCNLSNLTETIRTYLQHKKYFIVIDGLWALSTWDLILQALPDDKCFSRILTTTEVEAVANRSCGHNSNYMLRMEPLSKEKQQELFFRRIHGKQPVLSESSNEVSSETINLLKVFSSQIVSKCGGFPLAIVSISSLLASQPQDKIEKWNDIWSSLSSNLKTNPTEEGMKQVLSLCYNSLPDHLKTCMLYLSTYKQCHIMWKDDLVKLWIAEGFICEKKGKGIEEVASTYFDELVTKGMIEPVHYSHNGQVISCTVHYMVLQLLQRKSIEENFVIAIHHSETNIRLADKVRRLCLHFGDAVDAKPPDKLELSQVRTLAFYGLFGCMPSLAEFQLLRVIILDLWGDHDHIKLELPTVCMLRYLEISCNVELILEIQLQGLQYLEALKIDSRRSEVPQDIAYLPRLLHLSLPGQTNLPNCIGHMSSLRTFGCFNLSSNSADNVQSLHKLTNLRDLRLTCSTMLYDNLKENFGILSSVLPELSNLKSLTLLPAENSSSANILGASSSDKNIPCDRLLTVSPPSALLEKLELSPRICIFSKLPGWIGELGNLSILKIATRELSQSEIDTLNSLAALSALLLYVSIPKSKRIVLKKGFRVLKHFKFVCSTHCLAFEKEAMPNLRILKLGFNTNRLDHYSLAEAGFENLKRLSDFSAKIGCAGAPERGRLAMSALEDALRSGDRQPIINIHLVDRVSDYDEEMSPVGKTDEAQTLDEAEMVSGDKDSSPAVEISGDDIRITMSSDPSSSTGNQGYFSQMEKRGDLNQISELLTPQIHSDQPQSRECHQFDSTTKTQEKQSGVLENSPDEDKIRQYDRRNSAVVGSSSYFPKAGRNFVVPSSSSFLSKASRNSAVFGSSSYLAKAGATKRMPKNAYSPGDTALGMKYVITQYMKQERLRAKNDIASIKLEMDLMTTIIAENNKENGSGTLLQKWVMQLQDLVHDIEDFIDVYNWLHIRSWRLTLAHMSHIVHLKNRIKIIREWQPNAILRKNESNSAAPSGPSTICSPDYAPQGALVGMDSHRHELQQFVLYNDHYDDRSDKPIMVMTIVGPRGIGKTALAISVCNDNNIRYNFDKFAWVVASNCSSTEDLVSEICEQVDAKASRPSDSYKLKDIVQHRRCLVIIDDLQQASMWHDIQNSLAGAVPGSRIIVTTRIQSVAATCSPERCIIRLQGLHLSGSRELFTRTLGRPDTVEGDGVMLYSTAAQEHALCILQHCRGLPMAIISVANYLRGHGQKNLTERIASINSYLAGRPGSFDGMTTVFTKDYNSLPDSVHRTCLLSLSTFPTGHLINRKSLIRRWIAEGFVAGDGSGRSAEQIANDCFEELIDRNIIVPMSISINSKVKRCRVNDFLLGCIVNRSVSKNFVALIRGDEPSCSGAGPVRRLSVHGGTEQSRKVAMEMGLNRVRSLTINHCVPLDFRSCRLLRVLDIEGCNQIDGGVCTAICSLVLLKYLSLRDTNVSCIPSDIRNLSGLETLDIRKKQVYNHDGESETAVVNLPIDVFMLPRLAQLFGRFQLPQELKNKKRKTVLRFFSEESRLHTLSGFVMERDSGYEYEDIVLHIRPLRKLKIWCERDISDNSGRHLVSSLQKRFKGNNALGSLSIDFLGKNIGECFWNCFNEPVCSVRSIKLRGVLGERLPRYVTFTSNYHLSELQLSSTGLRLEVLSTLQKLRHLLYLKLAEDGDGFPGNTFVVGRDGFASLERLCFQAPKLPPVHIMEGAMPALTSLHLLCPKSEHSRHRLRVDEQETTSEIKRTNMEWQIEHLKNLNELVLYSSIGCDYQEFGFWTAKAQRHINRPRITIENEPSICAIV